LKEKMDTNKLKQERLGMSLGKANNQLRKRLLFLLAQKLGLCECFRCGKAIETVNDFTIDHKEPWLYAASPQEMFFDVNNIAFSHVRCNYGSRSSYGPLPKQNEKGEFRCRSCKKFLPDNEFGPTSKQHARRTVRDRCNKCRKETNWDNKK